MVFSLPPIGGAQFQFVLLMVTFALAIKENFTTKSHSYGSDILGNNW